MEPAAEEPAAVESVADWAAMAEVLLPETQTVNLSCMKWSSPPPFSPVLAWISWTFDCSPRMKSPFRIRCGFFLQRMSVKRYPLNSSMNLWQPMDCGS